MMIEIKGVGTKNKGAHLLLLAILHEFAKRGMKADFCAAPGFGMNAIAASQHGMQLKAGLKSKKNSWKSILQLLTKKRRGNQGSIKDHEIDLVLDASGFAYGDFWGHMKPLQRMDNVINGKVRPDVKTILLPQALGPFNDAYVRSAFQKVVNKVDLIFARDEQSLDHLTNHFEDKSKFLLGPDFTNLLEVEGKEEYPEGNIAIIPNYKMNGEGYENYLGFLKNSIAYLIKKKKKRPYFLIHEGVQDRAIAVKLNQDLQINLPIIMEENPLDIKRRIKSCELVIVSRFHGLVSALCQGIPVVSTSWSHKYRMLLKDYKQEESLFDINNYKMGDLEKLIEARLGVSKAEYYHQQKDIILTQKERATLMWDKVFELIHAK
ncbi:polysaccharide pyruvyl transferase family protein [Negadavirga shengliensis]|uniref:Polysaccharide pyruvyl transferase family protein n=1 Tax=Negadavirga shengliensis TaxID=1389218 RepID=A0ABV9SZ39_9BACT